MPECIFCNIISKKLPAEFVYQDDTVVAFKDVQPQAPFHFLIVPKKHLETLNDMSQTPELYGKLMQVAVSLAKEHGFDTSGYRIVANCHEDGGQTVYHVHFHLLGGRHLIWPPG